jgi:hypothetical protein
MKRHLKTCCFLAVAALLTAPDRAAHGQIAYGVNSAMNLFSFNVNTPANVTTHGPVGFLPEGIDFRPGTGTLYAIDIGPNTSQLYTLNITNGSATPVGAGFTSTGVVNNVNYNLTGNQTFGFDFNPKTLQADNSMRIRLVATNNSNLRLNSSTGAVAAVDGNLAFGNGNSPFVDAAAYINNVPESAGTTALYDMDSRNDELLLQSPPNNGTVASVGAFGVGIDAERNIGFDVYTTPGNTDPTTAGDAGYAVFRRTATAGGAYLIYNVNLATGATTGGALVGPPATPFNFDGGFAINPVPEPTAALMAALAGVALLRRRMA